ncbi:MAG: nucleoside kinase [Clostridium sp.]|uniref:nucleoside kinase n=1 Tax=Clostridium sp. DSM 8431 TaxID=1761781 RepID=UPI0008F05F3B|nr:nucleoside kinase [Clostridium sp. DSM 8431]MCR4944468.1 nucleoside kinase [Clostridium sp.]SFU74910.1 uridine kinase [Clostridium sp. DSM 8431]
MEKFKINLENNEIYINGGTTFKYIIDKYLEEDNIVLCSLSGKFYELGVEIPASGDLKIVTTDVEEGWKVYSRTLQFIFIKAALDLFPNSQITIEHSISKGIFGEISKDTALTDEEIKLIKNRMIDIINSDMKINKIEVDKEKAVEIFKGYNMQDKVTLLNQMDFEKVKLYELDGRYDYFYGQMAYSTGIIKAFDLVRYAHGFVLRNPSIDDIKSLKPFKEQKKLASIFYETKQWLRIMGVSEVGSLNEKVLKETELKDLILVSEALHEKKIAYIADQIASKKDIKVVLIAGPSSSGKTTFSKRLSIQLRVNGLTPVPISLDDYFLNREDSPKDENGDYNFETIDAIDIKLFNENLNELMKGNEVEIPSYNFKKGKREWLHNKLKLPENGVVVVEGIHGLNPILTSEIEDNNKFKIYISALTQLSLDNHNRIATTDVRKIRRIVRDFLSRGYGGEDTLKMWPSIRKGEKKNIFVYQEEADAMFNSTLVYELSVLKDYAIKELDKIKPESPVYNEAVRLKSFISFFKTIEFKDVPENSILREFIGGSCFYRY